MISNEHPEILERLMPDPLLQPRVAAALELLRNARQMRVTSEAGTDLRIDVTGAPVRGNAGYLDPAAKVAYWPGGLCLCFPKAGTVNGTLVMAPGDVNLTFKRYLESPIRMSVAQDYVTAIEGDGLDAALMRSYIEAWGERDAYAVSHVGWGMNPRARWDALALYDKADVNGTELRAFAGNFLYSTGANETAGRFTRGHFDLPLQELHHRARQPRRGRARPAAAAAGVAAPRRRSAASAWPSRPRHSARRALSRRYTTLFTGPAAAAMAPKRRISIRLRNYSL